MNRKEIRGFVESAPKGPATLQFLSVALAEEIAAQLADMNEFLRELRDADDDKYDRAAEIKKFSITSRGAAFAVFHCAGCDSDFTFEGDAGDRGAAAPKFCPNCGRRNKA